jgi:PBP1b-binding outer membrane lipoprotein LpoB
MKRNILLVFLGVLFISGCAKRPESISASYVSYEKYTDSDCVKLNNDMDGARDKLTEVSKEQNDKATGDAWGVFLIGVPLSQLSGDVAGEVAHYKGEVEAIKTAQIKNKCL